MDEIDVFVGHWIDSQPYVLDKIWSPSRTGWSPPAGKGVKKPTGDDIMDLIKKKARLYDVKIPESIADCNSWVAHYFRYLVSTKSTYGEKKSLVNEPVKYMNGRMYYPFMPMSLEFSVTKPLKRGDRSDLLFALEPYQNIDYDLSSLMCSQFVMGSAGKGSRITWAVILDMMKKCPLSTSCDPCTTVGRKISTSLIKIAALRIFASPEQSIIELPVNSIDAYNPGRRVGKFGMGFFSILYWLIGHPKRFMNLYSFYRGPDGKYGTYSVTIRAMNDASGGSLTFNLKIYPLSEVTTTGFRAEINTELDPFDAITIQNFKDQMHKLDFTTGATLYEERSLAGVYVAVNSGYLDPRPKTITSSQPKTPVIAYSISEYGLVMEDFATGIPMEVLLGVTFVPSLSTKTIVSSLEPTISFKSNSRIVGDKPRTLVIMVNEICVVSITLSTKSKGLLNAPQPHNKDVFLLELPPNTRLPVSRDDVILTTDTVSEMKAGIATLLELSADKLKSIVKLQKLLRKYSEFTVSMENKNVVDFALSLYFEQNKYRLIPADHSSIYKTLSKMMISTNTTPSRLKNVHFVASRRYDVASVESWLDEGTRSDSQIWYGVKVITLKMSEGPRVTLAGLVNYLFIREDYKTTLGAGWVGVITGSFFDVKLYPYNLEGAEKDVTKYSTMEAIYDPGSGTKGAGMIKLKDAIKTDRARRFTYSVLNKYESLDIYFKFETTSDLKYLANNLSRLYRFFPEDNYISILLEIIRKFSEFKGNQTYGGSKYSLMIIPMDAQLLDGKENKNMDRLMEHIINTIRAVKESNRTDFKISNRNDTQQVFDLDHSKEYQTFCSTVQQNTTSHRDFIAIMAGTGRAFLDRNTGGRTGADKSRISGINLDLVKSYALESIQKNLKDGSSISLYDFYSMWENQSYLQADMTYSFLNKQKSAGHQWVKNFRADLVDSIKIYKAPIKIKDAKSFRLSTLLNYLFAHPLPETVPKNNKLTVSKFQEFLDDITSQPAQQTPLQIIEIAINEGTTKPFIDAVLTELVQNSIDVIRENSVRGEIGMIDIGVEKSPPGEGVKKIYLSIKDDVGMDMKAFLYVGIPFLSTKTPSEMVTGEMGSGFFNVYRESSLVTIQTVATDGIQKICRDIPIKDHTGRVVDVEKTMIVMNRPQTKKALKVKTGTSITIEIPVKDDFEYATVVGKISYIVKNVLGMALTSPILPFDIFFNKSLVTIPKILCGRVGHFEIYGANLQEIGASTKAVNESYLLTKGIPFAPLAPFFVDAIDGVETMRKNMIVNITHGGYTPVQTRTRINIPEPAKADFEKTGLYVAFVSALRAVVDDKVIAARVFDHFNSTADADQLKFQVYNIIPGTKYNDGYILRYLKYMDQPSITILINMCIAILDGDMYENKKVKIEKELNKYLCGYPVVDSMVRLVVREWLRPKNKPKPEPPGATPASTPGGGRTVIISKEPDQPEPEIEPIIRKWINVYYDIAKTNSVFGFSTAPPKTKVVYSIKNMGQLGWYERKSNTITINTYTWYEDKKADAQRLRMIKILKSKFPNPETTLKDNDLYSKFFAYGFPAATIPHELEHYRRKNQHTGGHDSMTVKLYPDEDTKVGSRTFDQVSNAVYQYVLACGFLEKFNAS